MATVRFEAKTAAELKSNEKEQTRVEAALKELRADFNSGVAEMRTSAATSAAFIQSQAVLNTLTTKGLESLTNKADQQTVQIAKLEGKVDALTVLHQALQQQKT